MYSLILTTINHKIRAPPQSKKNFGGGGLLFLGKKYEKKRIFRKFETEKR